MHIEKKELVYEATTSDRFKKMVFSADGRFLACFTGEPDYQLVYLDLNNPKKKEDIPTCTVKFEIHKISINPK
jgi:beta-xylosidase